MKTPQPAAGARASAPFWENHNLPYDIINNPLNYTEILEKSGQSLSPCVEVNGHMLADVNGDEVEAYLLEAGVLHLTAAVADAPANWACDAHHHE